MQISHAGTLPPADALPRLQIHYNAFLAGASSVDRGAPDFQLDLRARLLNV